MENIAVYMEEILATLEHSETFTVSLRNARLRVAALRLENQGHIVRLFEDKSGVVYTVNDYADLG